MPRRGAKWGSIRVGREAEGVKEKHGQESLLGFPWEEMGKTGGVASVKNLSRSLGDGSCL